MFSHNSSFLIKQRYLKYKPLQKQLLVCNRSCKQNLAFKNTIKALPIKLQVLFIGHIILHNDNKKISIELKEGIFMAVTNNIREIREQRGIYQNDLAAAIGYSTKTVGRIERGDSTPSAEFMLQISKYFNMLVEDVFHVED